MRNQGKLIHFWTSWLLTSTSIIVQFLSVTKNNPASNLQLWYCWIQWHSSRSSRSCTAKYRHDYTSTLGKNNPGNLTLAAMIQVEKLQMHQNDFTRSFQHKWSSPQENCEIFVAAWQSPAWSFYSFWRSCPRWPEPKIRVKSQVLPQWSVNKVFQAPVCIWKMLQEWQACLLLGFQNAQLCQIATQQSSSESTSHFVKCCCWDAWMDSEESLKHQLQGRKNDFTLCIPSWNLDLCHPLKSFLMFHD